MLSYTPNQVLLNHVNFVKCDIYLLMLYILLWIYEQILGINYFMKTSSKAQTRETLNLSMCEDSSTITNNKYQYLEFGLALGPP